MGRNNGDFVTFFYPDKGLENLAQGFNPINAKIL
jgi:hypothetical protein